LRERGVIQLCVSQQGNPKMLYIKVKITFLCKIFDIVLNLINRVRSSQSSYVEYPRFTGLGFTCLCLLSTIIIPQGTYAQKAIVDHSVSISQSNLLQQQRLQYLQQHAQAHQKLHETNFFPSHQLDTENFDDFNLQKIVMTLSIDRFDFPTQATFLVDLRIESPLDRLLLLAFMQIPFSIEQVTDDGLLPLTFEVDSDDAALLINLGQTFEAGTTIQLRIQSDVNFDQSDPVNCLNDNLALHCIQPFVLPLNYNYYSVDLFKIGIEFQVNQEGIYPAATGAMIERPPLVDRGVGFWKYETDYISLLPAFTLGQASPIQYNDLIDLFPAPNYADTAIDYIGNLIEQVLTYYGSLYFPYPYSRLGASTVSNEAGVALGPMANIMLPTDLWYLDPSFNQDVILLIDGVIAHELGHQYFYNWVKLNEFSQAWLSEAFAEYSSLRYIIKTHQKMDNVRSNYWTYMTQVPSGTDAPIASDEISESELYFYVVYLRGAHFIYQVSRRLLEFDQNLSNLVESYQEQFIYSSDMIDFFNTLPPRSEYDNFDSNRFSELFLTNNNRLEWSYFAKYIDDDTSELHFSSTIRYLDKVFVHTQGLNELDFYFNLENMENMTYSAQGIRLDPNLLFFRRMYNQQPADVDCNGVVDGLDVFQVLNKSGTTLGDFQWQDGIDQNNDSTINQSDIDLLIEQLGQAY
jgi:hypothetical protein